MMVISNSSPLLALSQIRRLDILKTLFGRIYIPDTVYQETVVECHIAIQKEGIVQALNDFIEVVTPTVNCKFSKNLGKGEQDVLNLAIEKQPQILLIDDKRARNEAKELGFVLLFTTDVIKQATHQHLISSYEALMQELYRSVLVFYLPFDLTHTL